VFTRALHWSLSSARSIQSVPSHSIYLRYILILSTHLWLSLPYPRNLSRSEASYEFSNKRVFYGEELLAPHPTQYICSYPPYLEVISSIRNLRMRHAVVTRDPSNMDIFTGNIYLLTYVRSWDLPEKLPIVQPQVIFMLYISFILDLSFENPEEELL
jgi:hypothetical protein